MATFNTQDPVLNPQDFTGASSRSNGNSALGSLFEGIGNIGAGVVGLIDKNNVNTIKKSAQSEVDALNAEYGIGDSAYLNQSVTAPGNGLLPKEVNIAIDGVARAQKAVASGRLGSEYYFTRLESVARQLRARFPGYRDEIDASISKITGIEPANALARKRMAESDAFASDGDKLMSKAQEGFIDGLVSPQTWEKVQRGELPPEAAINEMASTNRAKKENEARQSSLAFEAAQGKATTDAAESGFTQELMADADFIVTSGSSMVPDDPNAPSFAKFSKMTTDAMKDNVFDDKERAAIGSNFQIFKTMWYNKAALLASQDFANHPGKNYTSLGVKDPKAIIDKVWATKFAPLEDALLNDKSGLFVGLMTTMAKSQDAEAKLTLNRLSPVLRKVQALQNTIGPQAMAILMDSENTQFRNELQQAVAGYLAGSSVTGVPLSRAIKDTQADGTADQKILRDTLLNSPQRIFREGNPDVTPEIRQNIIESYFGEANQNILRDIEPKDRAEVFVKWTSPEISAWFAKNGTDEQKKMYKDWATYSIATLYKQDAGTVSAAIKSAPGFNVRFDLEKFQWVQYTPPDGRSFGAVTEDSLVYKNAEVALQGWNAALLNMKPILEQDGPLTPEAADIFVQSLGVPEMIPFIAKTPEEQQKSQAAPKGESKPTGKDDPSNWKELTPSTDPDGATTVQPMSLKMEGNQPQGDQPMDNGEAKPTGWAMDDYLTEYNKALKAKGDNTAQVLAAAKGTTGRGQALYSGLVNRGFSDVQAAALLGNMEQESSFRTKAYNANEGAAGMIQWRLERLDNLKMFAKAKGTDWHDADTQMDFIVWEMKHTESAAGERFLKATTISEANNALKAYIRYGDNSKDTRLSNALKYTR